MPIHSFTIDEKIHKVFLAEGRKDPVSQEYIKIGDEVVFCAHCKIAFLKGSWELNGNEHCGQSATLARFPGVYTPPEEPEPPKPDPKKKTGILTYVLGALTFLGIGSTAYFYTSGNSPDDFQTEHVVSESTSTYESPDESAVPEPNQRSIPSSSTLARKTEVAEVEKPSLKKLPEKTWKSFGTPSNLNGYWELLSDKGIRIGDRKHLLSQMISTYFTGPDIPVILMKKGVISGQMTINALGKKLLTTPSLRVKEVSSEKDGAGKIEILTINTSLK